MLIILFEKLLFFPLQIVNFFKRRFVKKEEYKSFVISVGNITFGGEGKTPLVVSLAEKLKDYGKTAILLRGYLSKYEKIGGEVAKPEPKLYGDEASMIKRRIPEVAVFVGKERKKWLESEKFDFYILDDGFQYFGIKKDLEIIVHDFRRDNIFKRDFLSEILLSDILIYKGEPDFNFEHYTKKFPYITFVEGVFSNKNERIYPYDKEFLCVSSIGDNYSFKKTLEVMGIKVKEFIFFEDHHKYSDSEIMKIKNFDIPVITTEKDFVKLSSVIENIFYVKISVDVSYILKEILTLKNEKDKILS